MPWQCPKVITEIYFCVTVNLRVMSSFGALNVRYFFSEIFITVVLMTLLGIIQLGIDSFLIFWYI